jgi:hypothetical protein
METPPCCAVLTSAGARRGMLCGKKTTVGPRCGVHLRSFERVPHVTALREVSEYIRELKTTINTVDGVIAADTWCADRSIVINNMPEETLRGMTFPYGDPVPVAFQVAPVPPLPPPLRRQPQRRGLQPAQPQPQPPVANFENLRENIRQALMNGVVDMMEPPVVVRRNPRRRPIDHHEALRAAARDAREQFERAHADWVRENQPVFRDDAPAPPPQPVRELAAFAADRQNIHTTQSVEMTKAVVERVMRINVPEGYRWNMKTVSKTVGEIIADCDLTAHEMVEMVNRYVRDDDVYDMGKGIYGKVLDGVWQYVRNSPDKADMCRILKQELKDNIGMCAQGNLTRLCNVLAGYMDGVGPQESPSERLGRELPKLMEIEDVPERMTKAKALLREVALPETEWAAWLDVMA